MTNRIELPRPISFNDVYMHDQCESLRAIVDLLTAARAAPVQAQLAADEVELREPEAAPRKATHRDAKKG